MLLKNARKKLLKFSQLILAMLVCIAPLAWFANAYPDQANNIGRIVSENTLVFTCFRWILILAVFLFWPTVIAHYGNNRSWSLEKIAFWRQQRLKIILWLILFELILCENILLTATRLIEGWLP